MSRHRKPTECVTIRWKDFGAALTSVRQFAKLSQDDVALECNVGHATVHRAEHGLTVSAAAFVALCVFMRRNPIDFIRHRGAG